MNKVSEEQTHQKTVPGSATSPNEVKSVQSPKQPSDANEPFRVQFYKEGVPLDNLYLGIPFAPLKLQGLTLKSNPYLLVAGTDF